MVMSDRVKMLMLVLGAMIVALAAAGPSINRSSNHRDSSPLLCATASFNGTLTGKVTLRQFEQGLYLNGRLYGKSDGTRYLYVHENRITDSDCATAGELFDPDSQKIYDLGKISDFNDVYTIVRRFFKNVKLDSLSNSSILNRSIVIHAHPLGTGEKPEITGERLACATITEDSCTS